MARVAGERGAIPRGGELGLAQLGAESSQSIADVGVVGVAVGPLIQVREVGQALVQRGRAVEVAAGLLVLPEPTPHQPALVDRLRAIRVGDDGAVEPCEGIGGPPFE